MTFYFQSPGLLDMAVEDIEIDNPRPTSISNDNSIYEEIERVAESVSTCGSIDEEKNSSNQPTRGNLNFLFIKFKILAFFLSHGRCVQLV